jgi:hypothetical protein
MRLWVGNTIFTTRTQPQSVKFLQAELASRRSLWPLGIHALWRADLPRQSDRPFRRLTGISQGLLETMNVPPHALR